MTRARTGERGAVAVIVSVLLAMGVIMGMLAISVDVGNIMSERRQLQNGADAAALALAQDCAEGDAACGPGAEGDLQLLADDNARDGSESVTLICGVGPGTESLGECPAPATTYSDLKTCLPLSANLSGAPYVEAYTRTRTGESSLLPQYFSQLLAGGGAGQASVSACARAAWGPPAGTGKTLPIVIGLCDWDKKTAGGTKYAAAPPYIKEPTVPGTSTPSNSVPDEVDPSLVVKIVSHGDKNDQCASQTDQFYPGGFGWTSTVSTDVCASEFNDGGDLPGDPGAVVPDACKEPKGDSLAGKVGQEYLIPVVVHQTSSGATGTFDEFAGLASFYFAGFENIPNNGSKAAYKRPVSVCDPALEKACGTSSLQYIWGWFTSGLKSMDSTGGISTGPDRGAKVVVPAG